MSPFIKLKTPSTYVACNWNLTEDLEGRVHWVEFFKRHLNTILALGIDAAIVRGESESSARGRADVCRVKFYAHFNDYAARPWDFGVVNILTLDDWRDGFLREFGFDDPFIDLKDRENEKMLPLLPKICGQLDALDGPAQATAIVEGVFAGNIFDMGAEATAKAFLAESPDFFAIRSKLKPRPWLIDDFDKLLAELLSPIPYHKVVFFIDNAGSDFLLGAIPMMRHLARRRTKIVLAANEHPTLNDMTIHDVKRWWPRILEIEPSLRDLPIELVSTGTGEPLIDLSSVSEELNHASADADLVILEGMGKGVESNLDAEFGCDALNIAMIKDIAVAKRTGGALYNLVCRFR